MTLPPPLPRRSRGLAIAQLIVSILGILGSLTGLFFLVILVLTEPVIADLDISETQQILSMAWIVGLMALLSIPSLVLSIRSLRGMPVRYVPRKSFLAASLSLLLIPLLILFGKPAVEQQAPVWLTALLNILLVSLPLWWFISLGQHMLNGGSLQRQWGLSTFSIFLTLPFVFLVEIVIFGFGLILAGLWMMQQPEFAPLLQQIQQQIAIDPLGLQNLTYDFMSLMQRPEVIFFAIVGITVIIPLIEEAIKPLGLWLLMNKMPTPAQGFVAGLVCGASFALLESIFALSAVPTDSWFATVAGRLGTGLLHTVTTGLNGWALASSWKDGKPIRIGLIYILTVVIHGLWNFFALLMGVGQVDVEFIIPVNSILTQSSVWVLAGLALVLLATLVVMNRRLRTAGFPPLVPPAENYPIAYSEKE